jgi:asparagine synthase (glutamine-hydrolysing)
MVVKRFRTDHTQVSLGHSEFLSDLPAAVAAMDQPTVDGVNTYIVSRAARAAGLTVALSGLGGDELFAGYDSFRNVPRLDELRRRLPPSVARLLGRTVGVVYAGSDRGRKLSRWLRGCDGGLSAYELQRELFSPSARAQLLPAVPSLDGVLEPHLDDPVNRVSMLELDTYMRNILLRDADVMSMAHSLELRVPLLDHAIVELVAGLPGAWKTDGGFPKPLLVEAVGDLLPRGVHARKKMGFVLPFQEWMRDGLRPEIESLLLDDNAGGDLAGTMNGQAVHEVWNSFVEGRSYWSRAWAIYVLKAWCERNLRTPFPPSEEAA